MKIKEIKYNLLYNVSGQIMRAVARVPRTNQYVFRDHKKGAKIVTCNQVQKASKDQVQQYLGK